MNSDEAAKKILFSKYNEWSYEEEVRILYEDDFYDLDNSVRSVVIGPRMQPALCEVIETLCGSKGISFSKAEITPDGIVAINEPYANLRFN